MKKRLKTFLFFITAIAILTLIIPVKLTESYIYIPEKLLIKESDQSDQNASFFYKDELSAGFYSDNQVIHTINSSNINTLSINNFCYVLNRKSDNTILIFSPKGKQIGRLELNADIFLPENLPVLYAITNDNKVLSLYKTTGEIIFKNLSVGSYITSIATDINLNTLISTSEGKTFLYNKEKTQIFYSQNEKIKNNIHKSNAISLKGNLIAFSAGQDKQKIKLYDIDRNHLIKEFEQENDFNSSQIIFFYNELLFFETKNGLCFINKKNKPNYIKVPGKIKEIKVINDKIAIITKNKNKNSLHIFTQSNELLFFTDFLNDISNFNFHPNESFYFKMNNNIVKFKKLSTRT